MSANPDMGRFREDLARGHIVLDIKLVHDMTTGARTCQANLLNIEGHQVFHDEGRPASVTLENAAAKEEMTFDIQAVLQNLMDQLHKERAKWLMVGCVPLVRLHWAH